MFSDDCTWLATIHVAPRQVVAEKQLRCWSDVVGYKCDRCLWKSDVVKIYSIQMSIMIQMSIYVYVQINIKMSGVYYNNPVGYMYNDIDTISDEYQT